MKIKRTAVAVMAAWLMCGGLLTGCAGKELTGTPDGFVDKAGVTYHAAPACYTPVARGKKCGTMNGSADFAIDLYVVDGMDSELWLAGEEGQIFYADSVSLPTLTEMAPSAVYICTKNGETKKAEVTDATRIARLVEACREDNADAFPPAAVPSCDYVLHFASEAYPGLYYTLRYIEYKGAYYLYDWETKARYAIGIEVYDALYGHDGAVGESAESDADGSEASR